MGPEVAALVAAFLAAAGAVVKLIETNVGAALAYAAVGLLAFAASIGKL